MFLTTFVKETPEGQYKADVHQSDQGYKVVYYKPTGEQFKTETFNNKSIHAVQQIVESWMGGIQSLNG